MSLRSVVTQQEADPHHFKNRFLPLPSLTNHTNWLSLPYVSIFIFLHLIRLGFQYFSEMFISIPILFPSHDSSPSQLATRTHITHTNQFIIHSLCESRRLMQDLFFCEPLFYPTHRQMYFTIQCNARNKISTLWSLSRVRCSSLQADTSDRHPHNTNLTLTGSKPQPYTWNNHFSTILKTLFSRFYCEIAFLSPGCLQVWTFIDFLLLAISFLSLSFFTLAFKSQPAHQ